MQIAIRAVLSSTARAAYAVNAGMTTIAPVNRIVTNPGVRRDALAMRTAAPNFRTARAAYAVNVGMTTIVPVNRIVTNPGVRQGV